MVHSGYHDINYILVSMRKPVSKDMASSTGSDNSVSETEDKIPVRFSDSVNELVEILGDNTATLHLYMGYALSADSL